eukprot:GHVQ01033083.1.p1 GENE.GHVQ01033083.1~~GHVQ01033083.1.p1  ORF type:complete len:389 (+),score=49.30 GHVQ01033083.1:379-1545(+)
MGIFDKFSASVCKANLKMAVSRAKLAQNKSQNQMCLLKREIAQLLKDGKEEKARIKAEQLLMEGNFDNALDILETLCELLVTRMSYMASEKECPSDLVSTVHSVMYCQSRTGIGELSTVRKQFEYKYGREWIAMAVDNKRQEVHFKLVQLLSVSPPVERDLVKILSEVAKEFSIKSWVPPIDPLKDEGDSFVPKPSSENHGLPYVQYPTVSGHNPLAETLSGQSPYNIGDDTNSPSQGRGGWSGGTGCDGGVSSGMGGGLIVSGDWGGGTDDHPRNWQQNNMNIRSVEEGGTLTGEGQGPHRPMTGTFPSMPKPPPPPPAWQVYKGQGRNVTNVEQKPDRESVDGDSRVSAPAEQEATTNNRDEQGRLFAGDVTSQVRCRVASILFCF